MGFPAAVKLNALVLSARRCCVCRKFKGVGIEVHHIVPRASGGPDTLANAIALCFDCHASAGHYNSKHPKGSRFSPAELKRHRKKHFADVKAGIYPTSPSELAAGIHVRHLICLDYDQARAVLRGDFSNSHFQLDRVLQSEVSAFMERVLNDDLATPQGSLTRLGLATPGTISVDGSWPDRAALSADHPDLADVDTRPVRPSDFEAKFIGNKLLDACVHDGLTPADIGTLQVHHNLCGEDCWYVEYQVRRPLFVFTVVKNIGEAHIDITEFLGVETAPRGPNPRALNWADGSVTTAKFPVVGLASGESVTVPAMILLSPSEEDDLAFEWVDDIEVGHAEVEYIALTDPAARLDSLSYLRVGPSIDLVAMRVQVGPESETIEGREFDIGRVYLLGHEWMMGSCPYAVVEFLDGRLLSIGEILTDAWQVPGHSALRLPEGVRRLHICEFEFETTTILSVVVDGRQRISVPIVLERGEAVSFDVQFAKEAIVTGYYDCPIGAYENPARFRLKRSLAAGGLRVLEGRVGTPTSGAFPGPA